MKELEKLMARYPELESAKNDIHAVFETLVSCFENGGKLLVCGNGGSASDADHIVGELMKSFSKKRGLPDGLKQKLKSLSTEKGEWLGEKLEAALPAISLVGHNALISAVCNDISADLIFAQQVVGYGKPGDVLLGISTSGNSENIVNAMITAKALDMKVLGLTGKNGGKFKAVCDAVICVGANSTPEIQELHLPVYHTLCKMLEDRFF